MSLPQYISSLHYIHNLHTIPWHIITYHIKCHTSTTLTWTYTYTYTYTYKHIHMLTHTNTCTLGFVTSSNHTLLSLVSWIEGKQKKMYKISWHLLLVLHSCGTGGSCDKWTHILRVMWTPSTSSGRLSLVMSPCSLVCQQNDQLLLCGSGGVSVARRRWDRTRN